MRSHRNFEYVTDFYSIHYNSRVEWLDVKWTGFQLRTSVPEGCEKILETLTRFDIKQVLNDNTNLKGLWDAKWILSNWIPRLEKAGIAQFAWIISPENLSAEIAYYIIKEYSNSETLQIFTDRTSAINWLKLFNQKSPVSINKIDNKMAVMF